MENCAEVTTHFMFENNIACFLKATNSSWQPMTGSEERICLFADISNQQHHHHHRYHS